MKRYSNALALVFLLFAFATANAQTVPVLSSKPSKLNFGSVVVGDTSNSLTSSFAIDRKATTYLAYPRNHVSGKQKADFGVIPNGLISYRLTRDKPLKVAFFCKPRSLGPKTATFAPIAIGTTPDPNSLPLRLSCNGIGSTPFPLGLPIVMSNVSRVPSGPVDFKTKRVGTNNFHKITLQNKSLRNYTIRISWVFGPRFNQRINILSFGISPNPAPFWAPITLAPGQKTTIPILFSPFAAGFYDGTIEIRYDLAKTTNNPKFLYAYVIGNAE